MGVNQWTGIGNVTRDIELKYTPSGAAVCNFSIAINDKYKDKDGNQQESTEFVNIVAWRKLAEIIGQYVTKGQKLYISGKLTTRKYTDREGVDKYVTEIVAERMEMLGGKQGGQGGNNNQPQPARNACGYGGQNQGQQPAYVPEKPQRPVAQQQPAFQEPVFDPNDSIPF